MYEKSGIIFSNRTIYCIISEINIRVVAVFQTILPERLKYLAYIYHETEVQ